MIKFNFDTAPFSVGTVLWYEFLEPAKITPYRLAKDINISQTHISQILRGKRSISPTIALKLDRYFQLPDGYIARIQCSIQTQAAKEQLAEAGNAQQTS